MRITYTVVKDAANVAKHGVSLADAAGLEWETALSWPDQRQAYGEDRFCAIGYIGLRLFVVVYTDREGGRRVISLRKANKREVEHYAKA